MCTPSTSLLPLSFCRVGVCVCVCEYENMGRVLWCCHCFISHICSLSLLFSHISSFIAWNKPIFFEKQFRQSSSGEWKTIQITSHQCIVLVAGMNFGVGWEGKSTYALDSECNRESFPDGDTETETQRQGDKRR